MALNKYKSKHERQRSDFYFIISNTTCKGFRIYDNKSNICSELNKEINKFHEENKTTIEDSLKHKELPLSSEVQLTFNTKNETSSSLVPSTLNACLILKCQDQQERTFINLINADNHEILLKVSPKLQPVLRSGLKRSWTLKIHDTLHIIETNIQRKHPNVSRRPLKAITWVKSDTIELNNQLTQNDNFLVLFISHLLSIYSKKPVLCTPFRTLYFKDILHGFLMQWLFTYIDLPVLTANYNQNLIVAMLPFKVILNFDTDMSSILQNELLDFVIMDEWYKHFPVILFFNKYDNSPPNFNVTLLEKRTIACCEMFTIVKEKSNFTRIKLVQTKSKLISKEQTMHRIDKCLSSILNRHRHLCKVEREASKHLNGSSHPKKSWFTRFRPVFQHSPMIQLPRNTDKYMSSSSSNSLLNLRLLFDYEQLQEKIINQSNAENRKILSLLSDTYSYIFDKPARVKSTDTNIKRKHFSVIYNPLKAITWIDQDTKILDKELTPYYIFIISLISRLSNIYSWRGAICTPYRTWSFINVIHGFFSRCLLVYINVPVLSAKCNQHLIIGVYPFEVVLHLEVNTPWIHQNKYYQCYMTNPEEWYSVFPIILFFNGNYDECENAEISNISIENTTRCKLLTNFKYKSKNIQTKLGRTPMPISGEENIYRTIFLLNFILKGYRGCDENPLVHLQPNTTNDTYTLSTLSSFNARPFLDYHEPQETSTSFFSDENLRITGTDNSKQHKILIKGPKSFWTLKHTLNSAETNMKRNDPEIVRNLLKAITCVKSNSKVLNKQLTPDNIHKILLIRHICSIFTRKNAVCIPGQAWSFKNMSHGFFMRWLLFYINIPVLCVKYNQTLIIAMPPYKVSFHFDIDTSLFIHGESIEIAINDNDEWYSNFPITLYYNINKSESDILKLIAAGIRTSTCFQRFGNVRNKSNDIQMELVETKSVSFSREVNLCETHKFRNYMYRTYTELDDDQNACSNSKKTWFTQFRQSIAKTKDALLKSILKPNHPEEKTLSCLECHKMSMVNLICDPCLYKIFLKRLGISLANTFFNFVETDF